MAAFSGGDVMSGRIFVGIVGGIVVALLICAGAVALLVHWFQDAGTRTQQVQDAKWERYRALEAIGGRIGKSGIGTDEFDYSVTFGYRSQFNEQDLSLLQDFPAIQVVILRENDVKGPGLVHLQPLSNLRHLSLGQSTTDGCLQYVGGLTQLRLLTIYSNTITDVGFDHLKKLTNLERFYLASSSITDKGLDYLAELPNLQFFHIVNSRYITPKGVQRLKEKRPDLHIFTNF
jgi:hypothetical protein